MIWPVQKNNTDLSVDYARTRLKYDDGKIYWTFSAENQINCVGKEAGGIGTLGYRRLWFDGKRYRTHRMVWFLVNGHWPEGDLDHKDGNILNNRIENLRPASKTENQGNKRTKRHGLKGVARNNKTGSWRAAIYHNRHGYYLGSFPSEEAAHAAYCKAAVELYGEFARFA